MDLTPLLAILPVQYAAYVGALFGIAAIVAKFMPPPAATSGKAYSAAYTVVNVLGMNSGHATNASAPTK